MTALPIDLAGDRGLDWLATLIVDVRAAAPRAQMLLAGAMARDLLLMHAHGVGIARATEDVDLAFAVRDWGEFGRLCAQLTGCGLFEAHRSVMHRLRYHETLPIDVIPFGGVERADRSIAWPPDGRTVMDVLGYREAMASATTVILPFGQSVQVVSLPALVLLKVLAWEQRHGLEPDKDASDLMLLLRHYLDAGNAKRLYAEAAHLLESADFDYEIAGAWLLGRDAADIIAAHGETPLAAARRVQSILEPQIDPDGTLRLIGQARDIEADHRRTGRWGAMD
jgi:predicted nucleotidyltransferase